MRKVSAFHWVILAHFIKWHSCDNFFAAGEKWMDRKVLNVILTTGPFSPFSPRGPLLPGAPWKSQRCRDITHRTLQGSAHTTVNYQPTCCT